MTNISKFILILSIVVLSYFHVSFTQIKANAFIISTVQKAYPNQNINVNIIASRSTDYNAVELSISFSNLIYINSTVANGWTPVQGPTVSGNTITFAGALLGSSAIGNRNVLTVTLRTQNLGTATITVNGIIDGTGLGTGSNNVSNLRNIQIVPRPTPTNTPTPTQNTTTNTPTPTNSLVKVQENLPKEVSISSQTHPNQEKWYNNNLVKLNCIKEPDVIEFSYVVDEYSDTVPDTIPETSNSLIEINLPKEGINYFHVRARNNNGWGPVSRYKIKLDLTPPEKFIPSIKRDYETGTNFLLFNTKDNFSEIIKYKIYINNELIEETKNNQIEIPKNTILTNVKIEAFDEADNNYTYEYNLENLNTNPKQNENAKESVYNDELTNQNQNTTTDYAKIFSISLNVILGIYSIIISYLYLKKVRKGENI